MVKTEAEINEIIKRYVNEVQKDYHVDHVILFGSYAKGTPQQDSDIDLAIVSPDFRSDHEMSILQNLSRKTINIEPSLEVVAFAPEEMQNPDPRSFTYQVKRYGRIVYQ